MKMRPELLALFPPGVAGAELLPGSDAAPPRDEEVASLPRASPRRVREFAAGRHCAREALAQLGIAGAALPRRADRRPEWPPGILGAITHSADYAAAVVARRDACGGLGFDAERWGRVTRRLWRRIATPGEIEWLASQGPAADRWATVLFCAKEAFYKAQSARSGRFVGFSEAAFHARGEGAFEVEIRVEIPGLGPAGARFAGRFAGCAERCYAALYLPGG